MANPRYINQNVIDTYLQAGFDTKTGLPIKSTSGCPSMLKENIKRQLRIIDEQDAVNRYT